MLMIQNSGEKTTFWMYKDHVNHGMNYHINWLAGFGPMAISDTGWAGHLQSLVIRYLNIGKPY